MTASLEITTVSYCKNFCSYCPQTLLLKKYGKKEYMTLDTFKQCTSKVPKNVNIVFAGYAEPFLNPLAADMMVHSYSEGRPTVLYSTLVGMTSEDLNKIKHIKFINIALHLPDSQGHMICKVDDDYINNIKRFIDIFGLPQSHCYGPLHNRLVSIFPNCEIKKLTNEHLHTRANNVDDKRITLEQHERKTGKIKCDVVIRRKTNDLLDFNILLPNGDVTLCCMDYGLQHVLGNLLTDSYENLFVSNEYKRIQRGLEDDTLDILCRECKESRNI